MSVFIFLYISSHDFYKLFLLDFSHVYLFLYAGHAGIRENTAVLLSVYTVHDIMILPCIVLLHSITFSLGTRV